MGLATAGTAGYAATRPAGRAADVVAFHGDHQAGVTTPPQERLMFAAFDLTLGSAGELRDLMR